MITREQFISWCDKAMAFSFYALIYFLPISIALSETFTGIALGLFLFKRSAIFYGCLKEGAANGVTASLWNKIDLFFKSFKPVDNCLNWPIAFLLFFSLISVFVSPFRLLSISGFFGKVLQSAFLYFTFIECMCSKKRLKIFLSVFLFSCTLICINGIYQSFMGHGFIFGHIYDGRMSSSFRAANDFAAYLVVVVPVLFCLVFLISFKKQDVQKGVDEFTFFSSPLVKIFCIVLFVVAFGCLGLTYSRGAWVGFILSLAIFSGINRRAFLFFTLIIIIFLSIFYPRLTKERNPINDKLSFLYENNRLNYWKRASDIIKDYPLFGCGLNTYALVVEGYSVGWGGYPHNSYLQMAAETGLVGIAAFLWILFVLFRDSLRALRRMKIQNNKMLFVGFLMGLLGFLIHSFFDTNFYSVQLGSLMWIVMGVIIALQKIEQTPEAIEGSC